MEATTPETQQTPEQLAAAGLAQLGKLRIADRARLMADNQSTLDLVNDADRKNREYGRRVQDAMARQNFGDAWEQTKETATQEKESDGMQIYIDSPVTISQTAPSPATTTPTQPQESPLPAAVQAVQAQVTPVAKAGLSTAAKALIATALASGVLGPAAGVAIPWLTGAYKQTQTQPTPANRSYILDLPGGQETNNAVPSSLLPTPDPIGEQPSRDGSGGVP